MDIRLIQPSDAAIISNFYLGNHEFFRPWEPRREKGYHSLEAWKQRLVARAKDQNEGRAAYFIGCSDQTGEITGVCNLTNIIRGAFQACHMSYAISEQFEGKGLMRQICSNVIEHAFSTLTLNRIMANYMPANHRSADLLERLGFAREGIARNYLLINGQWEDHVLTSLVNPYRSISGDNPS